MNSLFFSVYLFYFIFTLLLFTSVILGVEKIADPWSRPGPGRGTPLYGLYRYVPRNRVWFLEVLDP